MEKQYRYTLEVIRIISSIAVVMIHTIYQSHLIFSDSNDLLYLPLYNILKFAVPLFVMITGTICLNPDKQFNLKKSLLRIIIPLFSFGTVFSILEQYFLTRSLSLQMFINAVLNVFLGKSWDIFWYLYMLIGLYLIMPIIRGFVERSSQRELIFAMIFIYLFTSALPWIEKRIGFEQPVPFPISSYYVLYLLMGYYFDKYRIDIKKSFIVTVIGICLVTITTILRKETGYSDTQIIVFSVGIYSLFLSLESRIEQIRQDKKKSNKLLIISRSTFGVYIIHMLFTNLLYKIVRYNPFNGIPVLFWIVGGLGIWTISVVVVIFIQRTPIINRVFKV